VGSLVELLVVFLDFCLVYQVLATLGWIMTEAHFELQLKFSKILARPIWIQSCYTLARGSKQDHIQLY
jgi:hypothetical protein